MAKETELHSEMAHARRSDGINVIFDEKSLSSTRSRSRSRSTHISHRSSDSGRYKRQHRSSSSSSSSPSSGASSRSRSRSHPRCYRRSSRCRCSGHVTHGRGRSSRSPPRRYRAHSRSFSRSPSPDKYSRRRHYRSRSRSRSPRRWSRHNRPSRLSSKTYRSRSRSSGRSVSLTLHDKKELLQTAKDNAMKILDVENLDLPESVEPVLSEQPESKWSSPETWRSVTPPSEKTSPQNNPEEPDYEPSPKLFSKGKISFSINNSVVKPTVVAPPCAKVTPRADSYESRKPYGRWVPVKSGRTSNRR